jgi:hypothetical protein
MKIPRWFNRNRFTSIVRVATAGTLLAGAAAMAFVAANPSGTLLSGKSKPKAEAKLAAKSVRLNGIASRFQTLLGIGSGGEDSSRNSAAQEAYDNRAYPATSIAAVQQIAASNAAKAIAKLPGGKSTNWQLVGPNGVPASALVAGESTGATSGTIYSGRATAIAIAPNCTPKGCAIFIGAAGGGVWEADNALDPQPNWHPSNNGIPSNAIGSIVFDPNDPSGKTLYAGTGEPNGSSDSEAGVGLYKSTDFGKSWTLVPGSTAGNAPCSALSTDVGPPPSNCPVATGRSIGAIAIDPANKNHIFIGTDVARHGASSVIGGRFSPPGSAQVGLYESTDGGATFSPALILPQDTLFPGSVNGADFFRGGCSHVELYRPGSETQVYASFFDYGVFRRSNALDGDTAFHQIFESFAAGDPGGSSLFRTEFSLAPNGSNLRVYVGDGGVGSSTPGDPLTGLEATFWRVDNANVSAATLFTGGTNGGWTQLSSSANGTPGFASFNFCTGQCTYDMPVYSPPGAPGTVYIGGAMYYGEIGGRSNGRAIQRSENAGVGFTDMTIDTTGVSLHPDQHAIASTPFNPDIVFIANDGGIWRLNGSFSDASSQCASRTAPGPDRTDCLSWLSKVPTTISTENRGLATLQYQSLSVNPQDPLNDLMGGTQDNGTHAINGKNGSAFVTIFGDGGQSGISPFNPNIRFHTFFNASPEVNFHGTDPTGWDVIYFPLFGAEPQSFYIPLIFDPTVSGTAFAGLDFVWRTPDNGGSQSDLDTHCNEFTGDFTITCGDWIRIGPGSNPRDATKALGTGSFWGADKRSGGFIAATERASDGGTLWVGTRRGRLFVSKNANAAQTSVAYDRIDTASTPTRFVSGIAIDPSNANVAYVSFSGYNAYATAAGTATGHVFKVVYDPVAHTATWTNMDNNLGDEPITDIALDSKTGDLFVSTDFGVDMLKSGGSQWVPAAGSLPPVAVYGLTIDSNARVLYAATHGRSAWLLSLQ